MNCSAELKRLEYTKSGEGRPASSPEKPLFANFVIVCADDAETVLTTAVDVMIAALTFHFPSDSDQWDKVLPVRFIERCGPHPTPEEHARSLARPFEERRAAVNSMAWSRQMFINTFDETLELRRWSWWDAKVTNRCTIELTVAVDEEILLWQSLRWLFIGSGAVSVEQVF